MRFPWSKAPVSEFDARLSSMVLEFAPTETVIRTRAIDIAQSVLVRACADACSANANRAPVQLDRSGDVGARRAAVVNRALRPLISERGQWARDVAEIVVAQIASGADRETPVPRAELAEIVAAAHGVGLDVAQRWPDVALRWAECGTVPADLGKIRLDSADMGGSVQPTTRDAGLEVVGAIHRQLMIDEPWTVREPRAFTWTAYRLAQRVEATPLYPSLGFSVSTISITTRLISGVHAAPHEIEAALAMANFLAVGSALVYRPESGDIVAITRHVVHDEMIRDRSGELASFAILQLCEAETRADDLAAVTQGDVATWTHPHGGRREAPDGMLGVVPQVFRPAGAKGSLFCRQEEIAAIADELRGTPYATLGGAEDGLCVEVAFGRHSTTLVQIVTDAQHPWLGVGLASATCLPLDLPATQLVKVAAILQRSQTEKEPSGGQTGAWAVRVQEGRRPCIAFCRFVPNAMYRPGIMRDLVVGEIMRARWVSMLFFPGQQLASAWDVMGRRDGYFERPANGILPSFAEQRETLIAARPAATSGSHADHALYTAGLLLLSQLAAAESVLSSSRIAADDIRKAAAEPWPLGYIGGTIDHVGGEIGGAADSARRILLLFRTAIGLLSDLEIRRLIDAASVTEEFRQGSDQAKADANASVLGHTPSGLRDWIVARVTGD